MPLIHTVVHLELLNTYELFSYLEVAVSCMSHLMHIAFNLTPPSNAYRSLCSNPHIRWIIFLGPELGDLRRVSPRADNSRFLCIEQKIGLQEIWLHGTDVGQGYWALAGAFIVVRRSGKVDRGRRSVADNDDL
ncbi:hypothetical protein K438DRAFT_1762442 [Mycena galopus ATCC 62051]|nr:hypothetical protein K438DRAFT_1762442 [Mycena galopus ATCC 62051]